MEKELLIKIATIWSDSLSKIPQFDDERWNNFLSRSNAREKIRNATWIALTSPKAVAALFIEKNITKNWVLNMGEVLSYKRLNKNRLIQVMLIVDKVEFNTTGTYIKQIREYNLIMKNNEISHVEMRHAVEDDKQNITYEVGKINTYFNLGIKKNDPQIIDIKIIPVIIWKGHLGDGITLEDRIKSLLIKSTQLWEHFLQQSALSGVKFLINGSLVETGNMKGHNQETSLIRDLLDGKNVMKYDGQLNQDSPAVENITASSNLQEHRNNLNWILTKIKELALAPDFNSGDKGTANLQTAEVEASMYIKEQHLKAWENLKLEEWNSIWEIFKLRADYKSNKNKITSFEYVENKFKKEEEKSLKLNEKEEDKN